MLRQAIADRLKQALKARDSRTLSTVRLMLAALRARHAGVIDFGLASAIVKRLLG